MILSKQRFCCDPKVERSGWICAAALADEFAGRVIMGWVLGNWLHWTQPPTLDMGDLLTLLGGLLGLGTLRTTEKIKGVA